jgi:hypothetical protein
MLSGSEALAMAGDLECDREMVRDVEVETSVATAVRRLGSWCA